MSRNDFQRKIDNDPEFAEIVNSFRHFMKSNGYTFPTRSRKSIFLHNCKTTLAFAILIAGIYGLAKYEGSQDIKYVIEFSLITYSVLMWRSINDSYAKDEE